MFDVDEDFIIWLDEDEELLATVAAGDFVDVEC